MSAGSYDITIEQGATWTLTARKTDTEQSVSSLTLSASTVTASVGNHDFSDGIKVLVSGANESDYNGVFTITVTDANRFTYGVTADFAPDSPASGTITVAKITDLSGYTARMKIKKNKSVSTVLSTLTTENSGISIDGGNGLVTCSLASSDTAALDFSRGVYDLEIITGSTVERLLEGGVTFSKEVTN